MSSTLKKENWKSIKKIITVSDVHLELNRSDYVLTFIVKQMDTIG